MNEIDPERELAWLQRMRELSLRIAEEEDPEQLLPAILDAAIELAGAERGYLVDVGPNASGTKVKVLVARGFDRETLKGSQGRLSRTVVERVLQRETRGLLTSSDEDQDVLTATSVQDNRVLSIICVPLRLRGETVGVLYLDHRFVSGAFTEQDLPVLRTFAGQAALALETAALRRGQKQVEERLERTKQELEALSGLRVAEASEEPPDAPPRFRFGRLIGSSQAMAQVYGQIERAARSWEPVLILGESGTGKSMVARELHERGSHGEAPFVAESCAAIDAEALDSQLFAPRGAFGQAGKGTLVLDDVADMNTRLQRKLLRVLQEGHVRPLGSDAGQPVFCRVIATSQRDLRALVDAGDFRRDLFYRLDVLRIVVPPLREHREDVPTLVEHFAAAQGKADLRVSPRAMMLLTRYAWPGNVRELENEVRRLCTLNVREVTAPCLSTEIREGRGVSAAPGVRAGKTLEEGEREMILAALKDCGGNKAHAARQLGVPRTTLYGLLKRHGLS